MSFADALDAPLVETIAGETVTLPILNFDDLAALSRQIMSENKAKAISALPLQDQAGRQNVGQWYDDHELDVDELTKLVAELKGAKRFLAASIAKGGQKDTEAVFKAIMRERGARAMILLAMQVSGIFTPRRKDATSPNAETAGGDTTSPPVSPSTGEPSSASPAPASAEPTPAP